MQQVLAAPGLRVDREASVSRGAPGQQTIARVRCFPYVPSLTGDDATTYAQVVELGDVDVLRALYSGPLTTERLRAALAAAQSRRQPVQEELPHVE